VTGTYAFIGAGRENQASGNYSTVGGGAYNVVKGRYAFIGGGIGNSADGETGTYAFIGGGVTNSIDGEGNVIGGGTFNAITATYAFIGGGISNVVTGIGTGSTIGAGTQNRITSYYSGIGAGQRNVVTEPYAFIGGGQDNSAGGAASVIVGGSVNAVTGAGGAIVGGIGNVVSGTNGFVGGGWNNTAEGDWATIPGGSFNAAAGDYSFAAGTFAKANKQGCFVWGDSTNADVTCDVADRWVARASGGVYFYTNAGLTSGVKVAAGGGSWSSVSDRNLKANFAPVDGRDVLRRLANIPIDTWNYKSQDAAIRHIGPVAQDFYAAFGVGEDNVTISTIDADGVSLAGLQGAYQMLQEKDAQIMAQQAEIDDLKTRVAALEALVAQLAQK
jgi:hypothetical protein